MIKLEKTSIMNMENAFRGMRMPMNSHNKSDSIWENDEIGDADLSLAKRLRKSGTDHRKFLRQIFVSVDITAPLFWWKEFDTYKIGTVANSCSTMHTIHKKKFEFNDFSISDNNLHFFVDIINDLNKLRKRYNETKNKRYWRAMIELLPSCYNQKRTVTLNYEVLLNIYHARKNHKLYEWHDFCDWIEELDYFKAICLADVE